MPSAGFETAIQVIKRLQTYALDRTANGIDPSSIRRGKTYLRLSTRKVVNCAQTETLITDDMQYEIIFCCSQLQRMCTEHWWNGTDRAELKYLERILSATLSTVNTTWPGLGLNKSLPL